MCQPVLCAVIPRIQKICADVNGGGLPPSTSGDRNSAESRRIDILKYVVLRSDQIPDLITVRSYVKLVFGRGITKTCFDVSRFLGFEVGVGSPKSWPI